MAAQHVRIQSLILILGDFSELGVNHENMVRIFEEIGRGKPRNGSVLIVDSLHLILH